ncbi:MAG: dihydroneopterin aldolase [Pseudomonadales bacterium]
MSNSDVIFVRRLAVDTVIGILDWERTRTQTLYLSFELTVDTRPAAASEDVTLTVDYGAVAQRVREHLSEVNYRLIETLANGTCALVLEAFPLIEAMSLEVEKPDVVPGTQTLGVRVYRSRAG